MSLSPLPVQCQSVLDPNSMCAEARLICLVYLSSQHGSRMTFYPPHYDSIRLVFCTVPMCIMPMIQNLSALSYLRLQKTSGLPALPFSVPLPQSVVIKNIGVDMKLLVHSWTMAALNGTWQNAWFTIAMPLQPYPSELLGNREPHLFCIQKNGWNQTRENMETVQNRVKIIILQKAIMMEEVFQKSV